MADSSPGAGLGAGTRVLLGVTGGIAAYKACEVVRLLAKAGCEVTPLLTPGAERFVALATFEALARRETPRDLYPHLAAADALVVAPLTANTLAKLAAGLADNVLTEAALAFRGPRLAAPAMNSRMWEHPATQRNLARLLRDGWETIGPEEGELAEGESGIGRMSEPAAIVARVEAMLARGRELAGKRVVVTAGGTREPIDPVRFVGNRSSGRMGVAVAAEAARRGADVTLVAANLAVTPPPGVTVIEAPTAAELARETLARGDADVIVMAAAVADYRPAEGLAAKRPKDTATWAIELEPTQDVLAELGRSRRPEQVLVGFAAETGEAGLARAREKLANKRANLIVFNDVSRGDIGFESADNEVVIVGATGERVVSKRSKEDCAVAILDEISTLLGVRDGA